MEPNWDTQAKRDKLWDQMRDDLLDTVLKGVKTESWIRYVDPTRLVEFDGQHAVIGCMTKGAPEERVLQSRIVTEVYGATFRNQFPGYSGQKLVSIKFIVPKAERPPEQPDLPPAA